MALNYERGLFRGLVLISVIWIFGFFIIQRGEISFSWSVLMSTPQTSCSDVYDRADNRLLACEYEGGINNVDMMLKKARGEITSVPFGPYASKYHQPSVWLWWLGVPTGFFAFAWALRWVIAGLRL